MADGVQSKLGTARDQLFLRDLLTGRYVSIVSFEFPGPGGIRSAAWNQGLMELTDCLEAEFW